MGWYNGTATVSSTGYNGGPWLRTMLRQASDNCRLPAMPISVGIAGMAELQICIVPFDIDGMHYPITVFNFTLSSV